LFRLSGTGRRGNHNTQESCFSGSPLAKGRCPRTEGYRILKKQDPTWMRLLYGIKQTTIYKNLVSAVLPLQRGDVRRTEGNRIFVNRVNILNHTDISESAITLIL
jgi:hypothetical protein